MSLTFSEQVDKLLPALFAFQGACPNVPKRQPATIPGKEGKAGFSYKYANIADVIEHVRPHLQRLELVVLQPPAGAEIVTRVFHVPSGQWVEGRMPYPSNERNAQALGGAITYVRRFALLATLGLAGDDDDDGAAAAKAADDARRAERQQRTPQAQRAERQQAARSTPNGEGPTEETIQFVLGKIRGAESMKDACSALKLARDTFAGHPAVADAETAFSDVVCKVLDRAESVDKVVAILQVAGQLKPAPKHAGTINLAAAEAKARIEAGS